MVDIHAHILPGIDDGALDIYDTLEMAEMAAESGVTAMIATPHCNIPGMFDNYFSDEYIEMFRRASNALKKEKIPVQLLPGMEVFATPHLPKLLEDGRIMTLNQSRYLLMEFDFDEDPEFADDILKRVQAMNAKPVIAHAERYTFVQENPQIIYEWRKKGYVVQVNKGSFLGRFGKRARMTAYQLLNHKLISVIASDAHSPERRTPYMLDVYEALSMEYPERYLNILFQENPKRICADQPVLGFKMISFEDEI